MTRRAFTLIEVLVVVFVIAILIGIMIPALRGVNQRKNQVLDLSNMRQTMVDFRLYASDRNDRLPNAGGPSDTMAPDHDCFYGAETPERIKVGMFTTHSGSWPTILMCWGNAAYQYWHSSAEYLSSGGSAALRFGGWSNYAYSITLITKASLWKTDPQYEYSIGLYAEYATFVRFSDVAHPSGKVSLIQFDHELPEYPFLTNYAFVDGSVARLDYRDSQPTAVAPYAASPDAIFGRPGYPGFNTLNGYLGVDF